MVADILYEAYKATGSGVNLVVTGFAHINTAATLYKAKQSGRNRYCLTTL